MADTGGCVGGVHTPYDLTKNIFIYSFPTPPYKVQIKKTPKCIYYKIQILPENIDVQINLHYKLYFIIHAYIILIKVTICIHLLSFKNNPYSNLKLAEHNKIAP